MGEVTTSSLVYPQPIYPQALPPNPPGGAYPQPPEGGFKSFGAGEDNYYFELGTPPSLKLRWAKLEL